MANQVHCAKCKTPTTLYTLTLWNGPNGFRRYPLCDHCYKIVTAEKKVQIRRLLDLPAQRGQDGTH